MMVLLFHARSFSCSGDRGGLTPEILILHVCVIGPLLLLHVHDLLIREMGLYSCSVKRPAYI